MGDLNTYTIPRTGDEIKRRILEPTTDDLEGGKEVWVLYCGDSKLLCNNLTSTSDLENNT